MIEEGECDRQAAPREGREGCPFPALPLPYPLGTRTLHNTVGKDLSQWFVDEPQMCTAALAGVALGKIYPSVLVVQSRQTMGVRMERSMQRVGGEGDRGCAPGWCSVEGIGDREQEWVCLMPV